ncbi:Gfo/Idh/MocA family oxidoreductase [Roseobacter sp. YSTF-M11]|uniref:Gfo/Idh/MocA family oxidoreductase n=1 Tax=Roseobacter insulae TaxID=2859783 RepID=A0A9X1FXY6_9RHOB|nr:Gfo/Idh/MocA family oxidoreductase [Roseobacter insulae]MBW4708968.1 Gfo/Idh/MocA family oxidoreductase [Roseobacter insulae]
MTPQDPLCVACLGAGYFSQFHYDAWARISDATLVGSADHDLAAARATGLPAFETLGDMLADTSPDILDIILPPAAHLEAITAALAAGVQTIICQKPFCRDLEEATGVTEHAERAGANLIVHENFRFMPWYRAIKTAIDAGRIGTPLQAGFRLRPGDGQGPRAYLDRQPYFQQMPRFLIHETGVHWVDTFRFLFGNPTAVYADLRQINPVIRGEDAGYVLFDHPNGVRALFDGNRHCDHPSDNHRRTMGEAEFEGTDGTLMLSGDGSVAFRAKGQMTHETVLPADRSPGFGGDCVFHLQTHVVLSIRTGAAFENTARDYLDVVRIKDAIYKSAKTGRKLPLDGT